MIYIGLDDTDKESVVSDYISHHGIRKVFVLSPKRFRPSFASDHMTDPRSQCDGHHGGLYIDWQDIIQYRYYYKLLQEIDAATLVVVNECMRTQGRHDLTYNCIRNYLNQTTHQLVFQFLPIIDTIDDFMILFDFDTRSRWKREKFSKGLMRESEIDVQSAPIEILPVRVQVDGKTRAAYAKDKSSLLAEVRGDPDKDPHLIPRNLLLVSGKTKIAAVDPARRYVGRNNRFKLQNLETYRDATGLGERVVFEPPHNFIDMADFLNVSRQHRIDVLVADTKADDWYLRRFHDWAERVRGATAAIHG